MPKMKSNSGAGKRFKRTASGLYVHKSAFCRHLFAGKKNGARKRRLNGNKVVHKTNLAAIARMLLYGGVK